MKKITLFVLTLLISLSAFAKNDRFDGTVDFLGIDFSSVDIIGAEETREEFHEAFEGINILMYTEPRKYDISKYLDVYVKSIDTDNAIDRIKLHDTDNYLKADRGDIDIEKIIKKYPKNEGAQLLIIAKELNKGREYGVFQAVIFDGESRDIISSIEFYGNPRGFGLRNYWAGALYNGLKNFRF